MICVMAAGFDAFQGESLLQGFAVMAAGLDAFQGESLLICVDGRRTRRHCSKASLPQGLRRDGRRTRRH